jgi:glycosyltransferase involved in cell wall biosynthesis
MAANGYGRCRLGRPRLDSPGHHLRQARLGKNFFRLMRFRKTLMCDPVCAQPFGHNAVGLKYFAEKFVDFADTVVPVCSYALPERTRSAYGFEAGFEFYYHRFIRLPSVPPAKVLAAHGDSEGVWDPTEELATREMQTLFERHGLDARDSVVFPCVDLYGAMALFNVVERLSPAQRPRLLLRFIGVMENAALTPYTGLDALLLRIREAVAAGARVAVCAETPRYAGRLASLLGQHVHVVPYPVHCDPEPELPLRDTYCVALPGSARVDKGFLLLAEIFRDIRSADPDLRIRLVAQSLPPAESVRHARYTSALGAIPGVTLLASSIGEVEMNALYARADLVLLPYDAEIYRYRGSAVVMESISRARPVLALDGPAFCDQVRYYGCGEVKATPVELAQAVVTAARQRDRSQRPLLLHARQRFFRDAEHAFEDWVDA